MFFVSSSFTSGMLLDASLSSPDITEAGELGAAAESLGFSGVWVTETVHSPFTLLPRVAEHTSSIDIGTAITVAFPRSPMVTAYSAWDIQSLANGRFILGLGTQVKGHIERRFDVEWESPGPRLRDYISAVRSIWDAWATESAVNYEGEFYEIDLCPPDWCPDPIADPEVPIYIAGVNEYNLRLAGELCDGLHVHPLNSPAYIEEKVVPAVRAGCEKGEREFDDVTLATTVFGIPGETSAEREASREAVRRQIAFYGSTRTYRTIFDVHGWGEVCEELHELSVTNRWDEMPELVSDEMVAAFSIEGPWQELLAEIKERYSYVDRVALYTPFRDEPEWEAFLTNL